MARRRLTHEQVAPSQNGCFKAHVHSTQADLMTGSSAIATACYGRSLGGLLIYCCEPLTRSNFMPHAAKPNQQESFSR
jgi:hypothetical protein